MEDESTSAVMCNECLDRKQATLFCTPRCADKNLASHRKMKHEMDTPAEEVQNLVSPLGKMAEMTLQKEKTGLEVKWLN